MSKYVRNGIGLLGLVLLVVGGWMGLAWAPADREMGDVQRIMYAHVPAVWCALVALTVQFGASLFYLFKSKDKVDALAASATEVGVFFGVVGVLLGAIWGRPTWGVWWTWDPRLTTAAILIVAYVGVMALRSFVEDPERRATWAAVASLIAFVDIPIVWFSVRWWRSLHQVQSSPATVDDAISQSLRVNGIGLLLIAVFFIWTRYRIAVRRQQQELALPERLVRPASQNPRLEGAAS